jgi:hypothetical protein
MPAHSRPKDGVTSLAYVAGIHVLLPSHKYVDGRDRLGHDGTESNVKHFQHHPTQPPVSVRG